MRYLLLVSVIVNIILLAKIIAMRISVRELRLDFEERAELRTNTLLRVNSRDSEICALASTINETLAKLRDSFNRYMHGDSEVKAAITNIAHDLRTPLTSICGYLELSERLEKSPEMTKYLSIISDRAEYMKKLTEELFEYSVIAGGEVVEEKKEVNVSKALEDCIMNYYPAFEERGIEPVIDITENEVIRTLYPSYVDRIINNLLGNALKYSDGDLEVSLTENGVLRVTNSSKKLSNVDVNKLFDRFFTVENARNNSTGLGLSIVRLFAERMNLGLEAGYEDGKITIEVRF